MSGGRLHVSDLALERFAQRSGAVASEAMRDQIAASLARAATAAATLGASQYFISIGRIDFLVRDATVVTVMQRGGPALRNDILRRGRAS